MYVEDTIAAIATPHGSGGIGIVRVSGPEAQAIGLRLFSFCRCTNFVSHYLYNGKVLDPLTGEVLDEVMAVLMKAPRSYTREDVLELQCHGGLLVLERILAAVLNSGARLAEPGEFTRRAFLNGRIDLLEAEAVMDVISSRNEAALALAQRQKEGALSRKIEEIRQLIIYALAFLEASIDFPEDGLDETDIESIISRVHSAHDSISTLLAGFSEGRILRDGLAALIVGKSNAGKSSLLNCLLGENRSIVTHLAGTTRDIIEETVNIEGLAVRLLDTAGIRHTDDIVELEGIDRTLDCIPLADLVLFVHDPTRIFDDDDRRILNALSGKQILVICNKSDLAPECELSSELSAFPSCQVSSATGAGIDDLKRAIRNTFLRHGLLDSREFITISRVRHRDALVSAQEALSKFIDGIGESRESETLAIDLRVALDSVGQVTGECTSDELLDVIFSSFCIGK